MLQGLYMRMEQMMFIQTERGNRQMPQGQQRELTAASPIRTALRFSARNPNLTCPSIL